MRRSSCIASGQSTTAIRSTRLPKSVSTSSGTATIAYGRDERPRASVRVSAGGAGRRLRFAGSREYQPAQRRAVGRAARREHRGPKAARMASSAGLLGPRPRARSGPCR
jgi:hypothetical protein